MKKQKISAKKQVIKKKKKATRGYRTKKYHNK